MFGAVVAEDNRAVAEIFMFSDAADNRGGVIVFPVERVTLRYKGKDFFKPLYEYYLRYLNYTLLYIL